MLKLLSMKRKFTFIAVIIALILTLLPACDAREMGSLKALTKPYIAHYECYEGSFGGDDVMEKFDYVEIILQDKENLLLSYKFKDGEKQKVESKYKFNNETHELTADIGIFGFRFKESVVVENGKFTVSKPIGTKQLIMKFKTK